MSYLGSFPFNFLNPNTDSNKSFSTTSLLTWRSWMTRLSPPVVVVALFGDDEVVDAKVCEEEISAAVSTGSGSCWSIESESVNFFGVGGASSLPPLVVAPQEDGVVFRGSIIRSSEAVSLLRSLSVLLLNLLLKELLVLMRLFSCQGSLTELNLSTTNVYMILRANGIRLEK